MPRQRTALVAEIVEQALLDGAVGFSTSRFLGHYLPDGRHVPGTHAQHDELVAITRVVGRQVKMQNVMNFGGDYDGNGSNPQGGGKARVLFSHALGEARVTVTRWKKALWQCAKKGLMSTRLLSRGPRVLLPAFRLTYLIVADLGGNSMTWTSMRGAKRFKTAHFVSAWSPKRRNGER